jgi:hypothetical protein
MRTPKFWLLCWLLASPAAFPLSGNVVATDNVKAHLVSEVGRVAPGQSFWVALEFNIRDGWHTYWRNPGDSVKRRRSSGSSRRDSRRETSSGPHRIVSRFRPW